MKKIIKYYIFKLINYLLLPCPSKILIRYFDWRFLRVNVKIPTKDIVGLIPSDAVFSIKSNGFIVSEIKKFIQITDYNLHPTIMDIYVLNKSYKDTEQFNRMTKAVDDFLSGKTKTPSNYGAYWCQTHSDIKQYFRDLDSTYYGILEKGLLSQDQLMTVGRKLVKGAGNDDLKFIAMPNGKYIFVADGGNHRFAIAQAIGLTHVNGRLIGIHSDLYNTVKLDITSIGVVGILKNFSCDI